MHRTVIKGRGENRGKYLRDEHYRKGKKLPRRWVRSQKKATRFAGQYQSGYEHTERLARELNGYLVRLTCQRSIDIARLRQFIAEHAAGADEVLRCYWIHGSNEIRGIGFDESASFCHDCGEAKVEEIRAAQPEEAERVDLSLDGGWSSEHDSPPSCATCGARLEHSLTDYGSDEEIAALTGDCAPTFDDANEWDELDTAVQNLSEDDPRWRKITRVVEAARAAEQAHAAHLAALAASPGMPEMRGAFLALLGARQEQRALEPSFRLWAELLTYERLPFEKHADPDKETTALEKRLVKEAKRFAACLGWRCYWSGGDVFIIEAPYGGYHWPLVVQVEQHRLWKTREFEEGRAFGRESVEPHRDANPYDQRDRTKPRWWDAPMSDQGRLWDFGYILGSSESAKNSRVAA